LFEPLLSDPFAIEGTDGGVAMTSFRGRTEGMKVLTEVPSPDEIDHFAWMEPWIARSGQPHPTGYAWLADHDFDLIVNLRMRDEFRAAREYASQLELVHIPIKNNFAPSFEQAMRWLVICKASQSRRRLLVHCGAGEGRTSTFCALVRIAQGMSLEDAISEQRTFGFQPNGEHKEQAVFLAEFYSNVKSGVVVIPRLP